MVSRTDEHGVTPTYRYDAGACGKGRLTSAADAAGSTTFTYDAPGRVTEEARVTDGISYATG